jgi:hypothetical protein
VVEDSAVPGEWRVETMNENGRYETVQTFRGSKARQSAIDFARHWFGEFDEIPLEPNRGA